MVVVRCEENGKLSEEIAKLNVGKDAPYRMIMHPSGRSLVIGLTMGGILRVDIKFPVAWSKDPPVLRLYSNPETDEKCKQIGAVKSMSFSSDGRLLALGGEDGTITVLDWPSLETRKKWNASEKGIRNVDFSEAHADEIIACVDETGVCTLWVATGKEIGELVEQLKSPIDLPRSTFFRCKSVVDDEGVAFYTPVKFKGQGYILRWRQRDDGQLFLEARSPKPVTPGPICGFQLNRSGTLMAAVTPDGDQCVISTSTLSRVKYCKGAHMTFATAVEFLPDDSGIVSTASDASASLLQIRKKRSTGHGQSYGAYVMIIIALVMLLLAVFINVIRQKVSTLGPEEMDLLLKGVPLWIKQMLSAPVS